MSVRSRLAQRGRRNGLQPHFRRRNPARTPALTHLVLSGGAVVTGLAHSCWGACSGVRGDVGWWGYVEPGAEPMAVPCSSYECSWSGESRTHDMFRFAVLFVTPLGNARAARCNACVMS